MVSETVFSTKVVKVKEKAGEGKERKNEELSEERLSLFKSPNGPMMDQER